VTIGNISERDLAPGFADNEAQRFRAIWTLWKDQSGDYELAGERVHDVPEGVLHQNSFWQRSFATSRKVRLVEDNRLAAVAKNKIMKLESAVVIL
jgi:hypothetical protein